MYRMSVLSEEMKQNKNNVKDSLGERPPQTIKMNEHLSAPGWEGSAVKTFCSRLLF